MADKSTVTLVPRKDFLFRGTRYRAGSGPAQLQGTLEDRSIQALIQKGLAAEPNAEEPPSEAASADAGRLEAVTARLSAVIDLKQYHGEHPLDYLERLADQVEAKATMPDDLDDEDDLGDVGTPPTPTTNEIAPPPAQEQTPAEQTPSDDQGESKAEGLTGEAFSQKLRTVLPDDAVATLLQNGIISEKALGEKSDAELKALPNLGDARVAKLREAFSFSGK